MKKRGHFLRILAAAIFIALIVAPAFLMFTPASVQEHAEGFSIVFGPAHCDLGTAVEGSIRYCYPAETTIECEANVPCQVGMSTIVSDLSQLPEGDRLLWNLTGLDESQILSESIGLYGTGAIYTVVYNQPGEYELHVSLAKRVNTSYVDILDTVDVSVIVR